MFVAREDMAPVWVVVAWMDEEHRAVGFDISRIDLGERPKMEDVLIPRAAIWVADGRAADIDRARAFAAGFGRGAKVFTFLKSEADPIGAAKRWLLTP